MENKKLKRYSSFEELKSDYTDSKQTNKESVDYMESVRKNTTEKMEKDVLKKKINREMVKAAKKGNNYFYWDITGLDHFMVGEIVIGLEKEGRTVKSKGENFKIVYW